MPSSMIPIPTCDGDFNEDGSIDGGDLGIFMSSWGTPAGDLTGDGLTNGEELGDPCCAWTGDEDPPYAPHLGNLQDRRAKGAAIRSGVPEVVGPYPAAWE